MELVLSASGNCRRIAPWWLGLVHPERLLHQQGVSPSRDSTMLSSADHLGVVLDTRGTRRLSSGSLK
jgi:hypothetical protein